MFINNIKISTKLYSTFGIVFLLVMAMVFITGNILTTIKNKAHLVEMESFPYAILAEEMTIAAVQVQQWLTDVSATHNPEGYRDAEDAAENFHAGLTKFSNMYSREKNKVSLQKIRELEAAFNRYHETGKRMAEVYISQGIDEGNEVMVQFDNTALILTERIAELREEQVSEAKAMASEIRESTTQASKILYVLAAIVAIIGVTTSFIITHGISGSIRKIVLTTDSLASGDVTVRND